VPGHALDGRDVDAHVEQVADEGAPTVVGRERRDASPRREAAEDDEDGLRVQAPVLHPAAARDR